MVAICDHLRALLGSELEAKTLEAIAITAYLFVEPLGGHSVELGEIGVDHYFVSPHDDNAAGNFIRAIREKRALRGHLVKNAT